MSSRVVTSPPLGLREYARHRKAAGLAGGTLRAVQVAMRDGRLAKSITEEGKIADAARADAEWAATTRVDRIPITGPAASIAPPDLQVSRARREAAEAELAEIELAEKRGEFVLVTQARADIIQTFAVVRTRLLAIPSRLRQRDHSFTIAQLDQVDELIREVLEELANDDEEDES